MATGCGKNFSDKMCVLGGSISTTQIIFPVLFFTSLQDGISPVYAASKNGHTEVVDLLVQARTDIHLATTDEVHVSTHSVLFSSSICGE